MKKSILKIFAVLALVGGVSSCGNGYLETDYSRGIDIDTGLNSVATIGTALNGTYYRLFYYGFAGNYAISIGDVPTDLTYWNSKTGHWDKLYQYTHVDTDSYLSGIWNYGYKVVDNSARIIKAAKEMYEGATENEQAELDLYLAEAYALRGYASLMLTNIFGHQIKVAGQDFSNELGIVVVDEPVAAYAEVQRSTVGQSYAAILSDFQDALTHFAAAGGDRGDLNYFNVAAVQGLMARTYLYMENWGAAKKSAADALETAGITSLAYTASDYAALYASGVSNNESFFALAIDSNNNWSANSCGTLWSTYNFSPSPKLLAMYGENDVRNAIFEWDALSTPDVPIFKAGKFAHKSSGNSAYGTNYIVNAPEMFLIIAEAEAQSNTDMTPAQEALLTVAKRNTDITSVDDLPSTKEEILSFIQDERARELFQEGLRLYDLRRWGVKASVTAYKAPAVDFTFNNYEISSLVYPIPASEINAGYGVVQNDTWSSVRPKR
ncbi:MAG: RagB/SusD family nutrient uptake outer membrane protein [Alistipes sp.]|nr:RagB/SusD family nutrient uptake outer membrane protein [Alistipes sp.]MBO7281918.1 RagB/SusD family nutrient uptake outer membrane protein [Alistipes sp.]